MATIDLPLPNVRAHRLQRARIAQGGVGLHVYLARARLGLSRDALVARMGNRTTTVAIAQIERGPACRRTVAGEASMGILGRYIPLLAVALETTLEALWGDDQVG